MTETIRLDPSTGLEVYTEVGGKYYYTPYAIDRVKSIIQMMVDGNFLHLVNVGANRDCPECLSMSFMRIQEEHFATVRHLSYVFMVPQTQVLPFMRLVVDKMNEERSGPDPLHRGMELSPAIGWRGQKIEIAPYGGIEVKGAAGRYWQTNTFSADCVGNRERCLRHIRNGGYNYPPELSFVVTSDPKAHMFWVEQSERNFGRRCLCGIYGFRELKSLYKDFKSDEFALYAQVVGWGEVGFDAVGNFKASDAKLIRGVLIQSAILGGSSEIRLLSRYFDWNRLKEDVQEKFQMPVDIVATSEEAVQYEDTKRELENLGLGWLSNL